MDVGQCSAAPGSPPREVEIPAALSANQAALERLGAIVTEMGDRLKPILREEPQAGVDARPERAWVTSLARRIADQGRGIDEIADRLIYLNQHLEI